MPAHRRIDRYLEVGLSLLEDLVDLGIGDSPPFQLLGRGSHHFLSVALKRSAQGGLRLHWLGRSLRGSLQFNDRLVQLGAKKLGQRLLRP